MRFLNKHSAREKELIRLKLESRRLGRTRPGAVRVRLAHPLHCGWVKTYALTRAAERRPDASLLRAILSRINQRVHASDCSFIHPETGDPLVLRPRALHFREWESLGWPASHRRYFELGLFRFDAHNREDPHGARARGYQLVRLDWLREDVQPHLVTHETWDGNDATSRDAYITRKADRLRPGLGLYGGRWRNEDDRPLLLSEAVESDLRDAEPC